jgi:hypothetical protein
VWLSLGAEANGEAAALCITAKSGHRRPLWVKSRHRGTSNQCPLYPQKRTSAERIVHYAVANEAVPKTGIRIAEYQIQSFHLNQIKGMSVVTTIKIRAYG